MKLTERAVQDLESRYDQTLSARTYAQKRTALIGAIGVDVSSLPPRVQRKREQAIEEFMRSACTDPD